VEYFLRFCQTLRGRVGVEVGFCIVGDVLTNLQVRRSKGPKGDPAMQDRSMYVVGRCL